MLPQSRRHQMSRGAAIAVLALGARMMANPPQAAGGWQLGER